MNLDKVPSKIGYLKTGKSTGQAQGRKPIRWGYEAKPSSSYNICSWTKLLLDNSRATEDEDALATSLRRQQELFGTPPDKPAFDVVSDYLEKLYAHCMETLTKHYEDSFLRITPIEFHLTVPAVWPQRARKLTLQAASKAGFTSRKGDSIKVGNTYVPNKYRKSGVHAKNRRSYILWMLCPKTRREQYGCWEVLRSTLIPS